MNEANSAMSDARRATIERTTGETSVTLTLTIDGSGQADIQTGIGFLDHMLTLWAKHGLFDLTVRAHGDLHVDEHHTAEDVCICLGRALDQALGTRAGIVRTAHSFVPMDEALALVAVDLGGRPYCV
ncbi:MAG: imidazoleglycerol-phosphate dehydratase, partial [Chloroflexi bacterium]